MAFGDTQDFLLLLGLVIAFMTILRVFAKHLFRIAFEPFFLPPVLIIPRGIQRSKAILAFTWNLARLLFAYGIVTAAILFSGSAIAPFFAEVPRASATVSQMKFYVVSSSVIGIMIASFTRILPYPRSESIVDGLYYQTIWIVGALIFFSSPLGLLGVPLPIAVVFSSNFFDALMELTGEGFIVVISGLLVLIALLTELIVYVVGEDPHSDRTCTNTI